MDSNEIWAGKVGPSWSPDLTTEQGVQESVNIIGEPLTATLQKQETVDHLNTPEVNRAAYEFQTSIKLIKQHTRSLTKKSMERVFDAVVEFPLAEKEPRFRNTAEHELFILTLNALSAKNRMMEAVLKDQSETLNKLKEAEEKTNG